MSKATHSPKFGWYCTIPTGRDHGPVCALVPYFWAHPITWLKFWRGL